MELEPGVLSESEVEKLLAVCKRACRPYAGARMQALIALMYRTGMRPGEALGLELADIRSEAGRVIARIRHPKGWARAEHPTPPREVLLDTRVQGYHHAWLSHRGIAPGPLFCSRTGTKLGSPFLRREVKRLARRAGVETRVHPHCFRHSFAHSFLRETRNLRVLQKALGHSRLSTTERYIDQVGCAPEVLDAMEARSW